MEYGIGHFHLPRCFFFFAQCLMCLIQEIQICKGVQFIFPIGLTFLRKREGEKKEKGRKRKGE